MGLYLFCEGKIQAIDCSKDKSQGFLHLENQRCVEDVLAGRTKMNRSCCRLVFALYLCRELIHERNGDVPSFKSIALQKLFLDEPCIQQFLQNPSGACFSDALFFQRASERPFKAHHGAQLS